MTGVRHGRSFTLIELMVVAVLMTIGAGMLVTRLDHFTDRGRLRSAATQIGAVIHLARTQARSSGLPVRLSYVMGTDGMVVQKPILRDGRWIWDEGAIWATGTGVRIERVLIEGRQEEVSMVRVDADGRCPAHAVILSLHEKFVVVIARPWRPAQIVFLPNLSVAQDYGLLLSRLEMDRATSWLHTD